MTNAKSPALHARGKGCSLSRAVCMAILATAVFLPCLAFLFTCIAFRGEDPTAAVPTYAYVASLISALFCGFVCARLRGKQGLLCGLLSGLAMLVLFLVALLLFSGDGELQAGRILMTDIPVFFLAVMGGLIGGAKGSGRKRRRRASGHL